MLDDYLGLIDRDPEPMPFDAARAGELVGAYENQDMLFTIDALGAGLRFEVRIKPEIRAASDTPLPPDPAPFDFGLLPGGKDEYTVTSGAFKGQRGFFTRDRSGEVVGVDLAGRFASRATKASEQVREAHELRNEMEVQPWCDEYLLVAAFARLRKNERCDRGRFARRLYPGYSAEPAHR